MLIDRLDYCWRLFGTALSFIIFGLGGVLIPILVMPALYLLPGDSLKREARAQSVIHHSFRVYIEIMKGLGILTYQVSGTEKLRSAKLILANHPTLIDVIFLIAMVPNANCIVKSKLLRNPFTWGPVRAAGYIVNDNDADVISAAREVFKKGHALIIFPEGTRSTPMQSLQLKRGAANVAVRAEVDITPVLIECNPSTLTKGERWYRVPKQRFHFRLQVKDQLEIARYINNIHPAKGARMLTNDLTIFFSEEIRQYG